MDHYRDNLEHVVRPEDPSERTEADRVRLQDWEALYLHEVLIEYAAYEAGSAEDEGIALGYAEYIENTVRDEAKNLVYLYTHTDYARNVLWEAIVLCGGELIELQDRIEKRVNPEE